MRGRSRCVCVFSGCVYGGATSKGEGIASCSPPPSIKHHKPIQALLPAAQGRAFNRTKKRKRSHGSNSDNLCSQTVVTQLLDAARKHPGVRDGLVAWVKRLMVAAVGDGGRERARLAVAVAREPLFLYGRCDG